MKASGGKKNRSNQLRIIAGNWRGRKLEFPDHDGLRPTADRVRETLFNWLQPQITGARVLDLCAGSGALGLEAASRGASDVTMLDSYLPAVESIRAHCELLGAHAVHVLHQDADQYLGDLEQAEGASSAGCFDIIFLDPPFASGLLQSLLPRVLSPKMITRSAKVYVEYAREQAIELPDNCEWYRQGSAGEVQFGLLALSEAG